MGSVLIDGLGGRSSEKVGSRSGLVDGKFNRGDLSSRDSQRKNNQVIRLDHQMVNNMVCRRSAITALMGECSWWCMRVLAALTKLASVIGG